MKSVLEIEGVKKRRENGGILFELSVPEFSVSKGEFVAVVGDSGCGKSTLLDILALVSRPTECSHFQVGFDQNENPIDVGAFWADKHETALADLRRRYLGYVLQTGGLLPFLTVGDNIRLPLKINGQSPNEDLLIALAERIGVFELFSKKPQFLSGGQRQRVAILRALAHDPELVLADEPTAAVDKNRAEEIVGDLYKLAKDRGTTIIMVTHDHDLVRDVADRFCTFELNEVSEAVTQSVCHLN